MKGLCLDSALSLVLQSRETYVFNMTIGPIAFKKGTVLATFLSYPAAVWIMGDEVVINMIRNSHDNVKKRLFLRGRSSFTASRLSRA